MPHTAAIFKKLTTAALLSAVGCTSFSPQEILRHSPYSSSSPVAAKKARKKHEEIVQETSNAEGPELGTPPTTGTAIVEVAEGDSPGLEKVPDESAKREMHSDSEVVQAGFVEQLPISKKSKGEDELPAPKKSDGKGELPAPKADAPAFPELTLEDVIHQALAANPDLQSAQERTNYAAEVLARARADFFPLISASQGYAVSGNPLNKFSYLLSQGITDPGVLFNPSDAVDNFHTQLRLQHELYSGGARVAQTRSAEANRDASHFSLAALQNKIVFQVAEAYYRLFQARELVKVREESVKQVKEQLKAVQSRFDAMTAVRSDVSRVEVRLASVEEALITARNQLDLAWAVLENVAGVPLPGKALPEKLPPAPWSAKLEELLANAETDSEHSPLAEAVAEAISRRAEVNELNSRREAAAQRARAAEAGKKPTLGLTTDYDLYTGDFRSKQTDGSYTVGLILSVNIFDGGRTKSMVRQAEAAVRELDAQQRRVRLDITLDVRRSYLQLKDASERRKVAQKSVANAEETLKDIRSRYENKTATLIDQLDAEVALTDARVRTANAGAEVEVARAALERAIGRLNDVITVQKEAHEPVKPLYATPPDDAPTAEKLE